MGEIKLRTQLESAGGNPAEFDCRLVKSLVAVKMVCYLFCEVVQNCLKRGDKWEGFNMKAFLWDVV